MNYQQIKPFYYHISIYRYFRNIINVKFSMTVKIFNGEKQEKVEVNTITGDNYAVVDELLMQKEIVTSIYVRNTNTREYIGNGSFYFSYDAHGVAITDEGLNFPKNLKLVHAGNNRFDFHIIRATPLRHTS
ncbi:hypothetical protein GEA64_10835 [Photorhabdus khanii]|uniref:Calcium-dependent cell adhesion molecule 1 membrane-binding domain-containing protein n=2 Tax=Morganellaceae TaxID=1903414 RepID=A0A7C9KDG1_9GAMM|nr:hypothetical protein [Photorhabdus khanii]